MIVFATFPLDLPFDLFSILICRQAETLAKKKKKKRGDYSTILLKIHLCHTTVPAEKKIQKHKLMNNNERNLNKCLYGF